MDQLRERTKERSLGEEAAVLKGSCYYKGWGQNAKLGSHSAIWGKLGTALQAYALNPSTKFPPNPTSIKVNNQELTSQH